MWKPVIIALAAVLFAALADAQVTFVNGRWLVSVQEGTTRPPATPAAPCSANSRPSCPGGSTPSCSGSSPSSAWICPAEPPDDVGCPDTSHNCLCGPQRCSGAPNWTWSCPAHPPAPPRPVYAGRRVLSADTIQVWWSYQSVPGAVFYRFNDTPETDTVFAPSYISQSRLRHQDQSIIPQLRMVYNNGVCFSDAATGRASASWATLAAQTPSLSGTVRNLTCSDRAFRYSFSFDVDVQYGFYAPDFRTEVQVLRNGSAVGLDTVTFSNLLLSGRQTASVSTSNSFIVINSQTCGQSWEIQIRGVRRPGSVAPRDTGYVTVRPAGAFPEN